MKSASIKAKGRNGENQFVAFLKQRWPLAERRRLTGQHDRGDVSGIPRTVVEVKSANKIDLPGWLRELEIEMINDKAEYGCVAIKPRGTTDGARYYCVMTGEGWASMLQQVLDCSCHTRT